MYPEGRFPRVIARKWSQSVAGVPQLAQVWSSCAMPNTFSASSISVGVGATRGMMACTKLLVMDDVRLVTVNGLRNATVLAQNLPPIFLRQTSGVERGTTPTLARLGIGGLCFFWVWLAPRPYWVNRG
jgi:hypothetical protein